MNDMAIAQQIHDATVKLLGSVGMRFEHPDAQKILKDHGVRMKDDIAFFTEEEIKEWMAKGPSQ